MAGRTLKVGSFNLRRISFEGLLFDGDGFRPYLAGMDFEEVGTSSPSQYLFFPPFVNHHLHAFDLPLLAAELPGAPEGAVSPSGSIKSRYLKGLTEEEMAENALALLEDMLFRGTTSAWIFTEEGMRGLRALKSAIFSLKSALPGALGAALNYKILSRPTSSDEEEWEMLLEGSSGFGLSAFRDDEEGIYPDMIRLARRMGKEVVIHFSEAEREDVELIRRQRPSALVHLLHSTEDDLAVVKRLGVPVIFTPISNRHFSLKPPVEEAVRLGLIWHLGSDNGMLSPPDMALNCAEASFLLGGDPQGTAAALRATTGEGEGVLAVFRLPAEVKEASPSPRLLLSMRFLGYAVKEEGIYLIRNTPPLPLGASSAAPE